MWGVSGAGAINPSVTYAPHTTVEALKLLMIMPIYFMMIYSIYFVAVCRHPYALFGSSEAYSAIVLKLFWVGVSGARYQRLPKTV